MLKSWDKSSSFYNNFVLWELKKQKIHFQKIAGLFNVSNNSRTILLF